MKPCNCGHWFPECVICGRPGSQLEHLAMAAGVPAEQLRDHLQAEIETRRIKGRSSTDGWT